MYKMGNPGGSDRNASACSAGDLGSIPGLGRSPGEGNGDPPQYSWLENPTDGGAWWATVHGGRKELEKSSMYEIDNGRGATTQHRARQSVPRGDLDRQETLKQGIHASV